MKVLMPIGQGDLDDDSATIGNERDNTEFPVASISQRLVVQIEV
jgi:hypothetical protein